MSARMRSGYLGHPVRAGLVIRARQDGVGSETLRRIQDALVFAGHYDIDLPLDLAYTLNHMLNHGLTGYLCQRFARKSN